MKIGKSGVSYPVYLKMYEERGIFAEMNSGMQLLSQNGKLLLNAGKKCMICFQDLFRFCQRGSETNLEYKIK